MRGWLGGRVWVVEWDRKRREWVVSVVIVFVGSFSYVDGFLCPLCIVALYSIVINWLSSLCKGNDNKKSA